MGSTVFERQPAAASVVQHSLAKTILAPCLAAGVEVFEHSPVTGLKAERDRIRLTVTDGEVHADRVAPTITAVSAASS